MNLPTFAATPCFFDFDSSKPTIQKLTHHHQKHNGKSPNHLSGVSYYFPKGVGDYHFGVLEYSSAYLKSFIQFTNCHYCSQITCITSNNRNNIRLGEDSKSNNLTINQGEHNTGEDCPMFDGIYDFCRQYAGASLMASRKLNSGTSDITINWSGGLHHAKKSEASGFCYVNDIVIGIIELLRVLYIDIDIHHGDGVQEAFYLSNRVCTVSFHKYNGEFFPGTGTIDEFGYGIGKNFSFNLPLSDGIDNESYVNLFRSVMEPIITTFRPSVIVLQCGADSLGGDRLGGFNISIAAHGECVRFIKAFRIPLMVLGGGGYTPRNVARCWTYETSLLVSDTCPSVSNQLPSTPYDSIFKDEPRLHVNLVTKVDNSNSKKTLEGLRIGILERLRYMHGAPSVQMQVIPPSLSQWLEEEEEMIEKEREKTIDGRPHPSRSTGLLDYFPTNARVPATSNPSAPDLTPALKSLPGSRTRGNFGLTNPGRKRAQTAKSSTQSSSSASVQDRAKDDSARGQGSGLHADNRMQIE
ncbi:hypothetical protein PSHT_14151 [Puccinia striiformis]|uniref:histone deacetylase n=1 Tax=Puccinia striiformis TaxID=27350 RepID=A0A2S4ULZ4_9BASI|nr:hypothetical protein PSHT_14151 [Puccinia striiformis]